MAQNKLIISQVMMPNQTNPSGNIYGGDIMKMMDSAAYAVTRKYARCNVVTARVDELEFHLPILVGDLVTCTAEIVFVGHSSMEVTVNVDVEDLDQEGKPQRALTAYFTMVALDRNSRRRLCRRSLSTRKRRERPLRKAAAAMRRTRSRSASSARSRRSSARPRRRCASQKRRNERRPVKSLQIYKKCLQNSFSCAILVPNTGKCVEEE